MTGKATDQFLDTPRRGLELGFDGGGIRGLGDETGWWCPSLSGNQDDLSGSGNHGTLVGDAALVDDVSNGGTKAYETSGNTDSYFDMTDSPLYDEGADNLAFSISFWLYLFEVPTTDFQHYLARRLQSPNSGWSVSAGAPGERGRLRVFYDNNGTSGTRTFTPDLSVGWQHIAIRSATSASITNACRAYADGSPLSGVSTNGGTFPSTTDTRLTAGQQFYSSAAPAHAKFDDIRIFPRSLTEVEIDYLALSRGIEGGP